MRICELSSVWYYFVFSIIVCPKLFLPGNERGVALGERFFFQNHQSPGRAFLEALKIQTNSEKLYLVICAC
jgi:hypothetical protein